MNHRLCTAVAQGTLQRCTIAYVGLDTGYGLAGDALDPIQRLGIAIAVVVQHRHAVARVEQFQAGVAADIAGAAGDKDVHAVGFPCVMGLGERLKKNSASLARMAASLSARKRCTHANFVPIRHIHGPEQAK